MKKVILFFALFQIGIIVLAQNFTLGAYYNSSHQNANFLEGSDILRSQKILFQGMESGVSIKYRVSDNFSFKTQIGFSQNHLTLPNFFISSFQYNDIPISIFAKINLYSFSNFKIYIENGMSFAFCYSYSYNRSIRSSNSDFFGIISDYNFKNDWSFGFINGFGISYQIKSKFDINVFANYYSGINKVWENNSIFILEDGALNNYTISSNGSSLNIGFGLGYCF